MANEIAELGLEIRSDGVVTANKRLRDMEGQSRRTERRVESLIDRADRLGRSMRRLGGTMTTRVTAPLAAVGAASVKLASDFESSLTKLNTQVGLSRESINGFREDILQLSGQTGQAPVELANALFAITSAGQRGAQAINTLTAAAKASAIGLGNTKQIALTAGAAVEAYGEANITSAEAVDILVGTVEQGNLEASQLAGVLGRVIGLAAEVGVSFRDVGAFVAKFTRQGVDAAQAVTGLRGVLTALVRKPTKRAEEAFDKLGMTLEDFRGQIKDQGFITAFSDFVARAEEAGISMADIIPEVEGLAGVLAVFASEGQSATEVADKIGDAVGTLEARLAAAEEMDPSLAFRQMSASMQTAAIQIGTELLPAILDVVELVRDWSAAFADLSPQTQQLIIRGAALVAVLGPLSLAIGSILTNLTRLRPILLFLTGPLGLAGLAAAAATLIGYEIGKALRDWADGGETLKNQLRDATPEMMRFTEETAKAREELLEFRLEQEEAKLAQMEMKAGDTGLQQRTGGLSEAALQRQRDLVAELNEELRINENRLKALNERQERRASIWGSMTGIDAAVEGFNLLAEAAEGSEDEVRGISDSMKEANEEGAEFMSRMEDLAARLEGPAAEAQRQFTQSVEEAAQMMVRGGINAQQFARVLTILNRQLQQGLADAGEESGLDIMSMMGFDDVDEVFDIMDTMKDKLQDVADVEFNFENLMNSFHPMAQQMQRLGDTIQWVDKQMNDEMLSRAQGNLAKMGATANASFAAIKSGMDRSSQEYKQMEVAQQAVNVALGIAAILQQGMGDPYTAIPRMIAMAAMVASLVDNFNGLSGGGGGAEQRQRTQGTGTVLGDSEAQSESISNAIEITADATQELVGINRGMLYALESMQEGLTGAATMLAQRGDIDFGKMDLDLGTFNNISNDIWDPFGFFGSTDVKDEGIQLLGGRITELTDGIIAEAFQTVKKSGLFGSDTDTATAELSEALNDQLNLVFESMIDTVKSAAEALGIPLDTIQRRIEQFEVEAQKISLKDLDAEEQQDAIEAVFSRIFDDLAGTVVPFVDQFQRIGEGLGETLVRVATSVQVAQEAFSRLGLTIGEVTSEELAQISVGLVEAAGGIEDFISQMERFVDAFASEAQVFNVSQSDLTRALEQVNLELPDSREGFWDLMQSLDATTESGQRQIATLLELAPIADEYYKLLEDQAQIQRDILFGRGLGLTGEGFSPREEQPPFTIIQPPGGGTSPEPGPGTGPIGGGGGGGVTPSPGPGTGPSLRPEAVDQIETFNAVLEGTGDAAEITNEAMKQTLQVVKDLNKPGESLLETFERLRDVTNSLDQAFAMIGEDFEGTRVELIEFGDELTTLFGGADRLVGALDRIFETFFSEAERNRFSREQTTGRATGLLEQLGIDVEADMLTLQGFRELWDDLFATLGAEGQAILIEAGNAIADLVDEEQELASLMDTVDDAFLDAVSPAEASLKQLVDRWADMEEEAIELGATEEQLMRIRRAANAELSQWIKDTQLSLLQSAQDFFSVEQSFQQASTGMVDAANNMRDQILRALEGIDEWLDSSLLSENSPLTPQQRLDEAQSQFQSAFDAAMSGDADALAELPGLADQLLEEGGSFFGTSTDQFQQLWDQVRSMMEQASGIEPPVGEGPPTFGQVEAIREDTGRFQPAIDALEREMAAGEIMSQLNALAVAQESTPAEIAEELGFTTSDMRQLLEALGEDIPAGTELSLRDHFNDVVGEIAEQNPIVQAMADQNEAFGDTIMAMTSIIEQNLWAIGDVLVQILEELGGTLDPSFGQSVHTGGMIAETGSYNLQAGEQVVSRNEMREVKQELQRIGQLIARGNNDRREGFGGVVMEGRSTRRALERRTTTERV